MIFLISLHLLLHAGTPTVSTKTNNGFMHEGQLLDSIRGEGACSPRARLCFFQVVLVSLLFTHIPFLCFGDNKMSFCINKSIDPREE